MRVVNPLNKTPMSSETMVNGGCIVYVLADVM